MSQTLTTRNGSLSWRLACASSLMLLASCGTPTRAPVAVGAVVIAPPLKLPPLPTVVVVTPPLPPGYFHQSSLDFFNGKMKKPTPSTLPTSPAAPPP